LAAQAPAIAERSSRGFRIVLIKPSHYDDDGYVIQWHLSSIPSNSLASVYGVCADCAERKILGPDVDIAIEGYDECNTILKVKGIARRIRRAGSGFVGLVGVQSNQFPRALDLARQFRQLGVPVVIGGFHVSGCLSMLPELPADLKQALALGVTLYAGEVEGRLDELLIDIDRRRAKRKAASASFYAMPPTADCRRSTITLTSCRPWKKPPCRSFPSNMSRAPSVTARALMRAAVVPINARSAPSSMSRAASHATVRLTTWNIWSV
jgi:hypothetical protein